MSFMGGGTPAAASPASSGRVNTYREAEAVPFLVGTARIAPKWISDRFNDQWSNGKMTGQAYCSIVGVLCHGPLDKVSVMYQGGEAIWTLNLTRTPGQDYASFSFGGPDSQLGPTYVGRIYWGTETQTADAWLVAKSGQDHPPYRGMAYVVFERLHCGQVQANSQAQPAVPNIEFLCTRLPSPHLPAELRLPATLDSDFWRGANFGSALYDVLTHPRAGLDCADYLDTASFIAAAQGIENGTKRLYGLDAEYARISVLLTGGSDAESVLGDFLAHADGFASSNNGLISLDWFPNDGTTPTGLPTLTQHDLSKHPEIDLSLLDDVPTSVAVTCLDYWADLAESVETCNVPFTKQGRGDSSPQKLSRPWITERFVAAQYAARHAALAATPAAEGKLSVLIHRAVRADGSPLRPGDRFLLNYEPDALLFICRVTEIEEPDGSDAVVDLSFIREHGTSALPYVPEVDPRADYELPEPATPGADDWVVMETPPELGDGRVVALIRRPQNTLAGAELEMDDDNNWAAGTSLLGRQGFAAHGTLTADITASAGTLTLTGTGIDLGPTLASGMTSGQQADNTLLAYIGGEWISVGAVTSVATDTYQLALLRGRLGSMAAAHTTGAAVWIIARAELTQFTHALFTSESTRYFKASTYHALQTGTPSEAKSVTFRESTAVRRTVTLYQYFPGATAPLSIDYWIDAGEHPYGGVGAWIYHPDDPAWSPWALHNVEAYFRWYLTPPPPTIEGGPNVATQTDGSRWALWSCSCEVLDSDGDTIVDGSFTTPERFVVGLSTAKAAINEGAVRLAEVKPASDSAGWSPPIYHSATGKFQIRKNATTDTLEWTPDGGTTVHAMGGGGGTSLPTPTVGQMLYCAEAGVWTPLAAPGVVGQVLTGVESGTSMIPQWVLPTTPYQPRVQIWNAWITARGGTLTANSLNIADAAVTAMNTRSWAGKVIWWAPLLGGNLIAAITPLVDQRGRGPMVNTGFVDADFSEATGIMGGSGRILDTSVRISTDLGVGGNGSLLGFIRSFGSFVSSWAVIGDVDTSWNMYGQNFAASTTTVWCEWGPADAEMGITMPQTVGCYHWRRAASNDRRMFLNGATIGGATTSYTGLSSKTVKLFGDTYSGTRSSAIGLSAAMILDGTETDAEVADIYAFLQQYLITPTGR